VDPIDPSLRIRSVALAVSDLRRSSDFYERVIGLPVLERGTERVLLGTDPAQPALALSPIEDPQPAPFGSTGLFHVAWLHPSRAGLAETVRRVLASEWRFDGASDHGVSEALYLSDPDGLGIELYADRPRERWDRPAGGRGVNMVTLPLDIEDLLAQHGGAPGPATEPGTHIGHVHLKVADVPRAAGFYADVLGFEEQARIPSAAFLSAGGYHHHIGLNSWQSEGGAPAGNDAPGLRGATFALDGQSTLAAWADEAEAAGAERSPGDEGVSLHDPDAQLLTFTAP
jgi:catechol 2,3-dioxygenase